MTANAAELAQPARLPVRNPRSGVVDHHIDVLSPTEVAALATRLRAAQRAWSRRDAASRCAVLARWADEVTAVRDELIAALEQTPVRQTPVVAEPARVSPSNGHEQTLALHAMANPANHNAVDPTVLARVRGMMGEEGETMVRNLTDLFLNNSQLLLDQLRAALSAGDAETVRRTAHTFRSPAAQMGAIHLAALCQSLEAKGRQGDLSDGPALLDAINTEYIHVRDYFTLHSQ